MKTPIVLLVTLAVVCAAPAQTNDPTTKRVPRVPISPTTNAPSSGTQTNTPAVTPSTNPPPGAPGTVVVPTRAGTTNQPGRLLPITPTAGATNAPPGTAPAPGNVVVQPGAPGAPGAAPAPALQTAGTDTNSILRTGGSRGLPADAATRIIKTSTMKFNAMPLEQALDFYGELLNRTILRPTGLPAVTITLKAQSDLTVKEAIEALDSVLALNGISTLLVGEKFVTIVPSGQIQQEAGAFSTSPTSELPEAGQYVTKVVQLKVAKPSEVVPALQPFAKLQNSIVPIEGNQVLLLRDYAANVKRMLEIIEQIDVAVPLDAELEIFPVKFSPAADVAAMLGSLTSGGAVAPTGGSAATRRPGAAGVGSNIGAGRPGAVTPFGAPGNPLGVQGQNYPGAPGTSSLVTQAAAANRGDFASRLAGIVQRAAQGQAAPLLGDARIIPDERTNSLIVYGTRQEREQVKKVLEQIDVVQQQVIIEAIIMEVTLDNTHNLGVSAAQTPSKKFLDGLHGFGGYNNGNFFSSTNAPLAGNLPNGFSYFSQIGANWQVALTAVETDSSINVLSRPRVQTSHAVPAILKIGETVPYVQGTTIDINGGSRSVYNPQFVGIDINVTPLITPDGLVVMDIAQDIQQLGTPTIIDGNPVPTTSQRSASAKVAVRDQEVVMLGGFISNSKTKTKSGVPVLKDIPGLGFLFRSKSDTARRVELIVLIRPTVLPTPETASWAAYNERERMSGIKQAEDDEKREEKIRQQKIDKESAKAPK